jgi:hypothetical protein
VRYIVLADYGIYTAGQVFDFNDAEAAATLIRTTGVPLLAIARLPSNTETAQPMAIADVPVPEPVIESPAPAKPRASKQPRK